MPTVHTRYVVWESRGFRHKSGSGAVDITTPSTTTVTDGGTYSAYGFPDGSWTDSKGKHTGHFAFWSVVGAANGSSFTTNPNLHVKVDSHDVQVVAWYIEHGGGGGPELLIDAFDVDIGDFVLDDFVNGVTDPSLTTEANANGIVPTPGGSEDVRAYTSIRSVPFDKWIVVQGTEQVSKLDLTGTQGTTAIAFAMYQSPTSLPRPKPNFSQETWVSWSVTVDGGGPTGRGPQPPWGPYVRELAAGLALADTAGMVDKGLRISALQLAADQVKVAADNIVRQMEGGLTASG